MLKGEYYQNGGQVMSNTMNGRMNNMVASSMSGGFRQRPISAGNTGNAIRMKSARKIIKNQHIARAPPMVEVLSSDKPGYMQAIDSLGISPGYHTVPDLQPQSRFAENSILIAPYEKRGNVMAMLNEGLNRTVMVALLGDDLQPDKAINHPQIELVTEKLDNMKEFLRCKNVRMNETPAIINVTSLGKMTMGSSMVGSEMIQQGVTGTIIPAPLSVIQ